MSGIMEQLILENTKAVTREVTKSSATQTALRMLARGKMTLEEIAEDSGLTLEEVKNLATIKTA